MQDIILVGDTDTKFQAVQTILGRLIRRINSRAVTAFLTNSHIHGYVEKSGEDGTVIKDMFGIGGMVTYVYLYIEQIETTNSRKEAELMVAIEKKDRAGLSKGIIVHEGHQEAPLKLAIEGGSRVIVKTSVPLKGVWYGLVIDPVPRSKKVEYEDEPIDSLLSDVSSVPVVADATANVTLTDEGVKT
jgi:hypothetical protein